ncbi:MAG: glycosyltransferase family 4 protein [Patescibacteria group bacterium]
MKIGLYSPFLAENIGGGERYLLTVAECLLAEHQVDLILPYIPAGLKEKFVNNFNLKLDKLNLVVGPFAPGHSAWERARFTAGYDIFYYMTDASFFIPRAKLNAVHFMIPFNFKPGLWQKFKLSFWPIKVANSFFTQKSLAENWHLNFNYVHWGAVNTKLFTPLPKKNIILNVGRFFSPSVNKHCKRQDLLVTVFKTMCDQGLKNWQLIFNGSVDNGRDNLNYFNQVKKSAAGYPIIFHQNSRFKILQQDYGQAKIYWHATGYGLDETTNPQAMEHLGISTVEAMAAGAVPIVIKKGGQPEIVSHALNGLLWTTKKELIKQTLEVIHHRDLRQKIKLQAQHRAQDFSVAKFCHTTKQMFNLL